MIINQDPFSMSFIVAFSSQKLHGIMGVQGTIDARIFGLFIQRLMANYRLEGDSADRRIVLVMDNASIHKAKFIKSIISNKRISIFTITPYEP